MQSLPKTELNDSPGVLQDLGVFGVPGISMSSKVSDQRLGSIAGGFAQILLLPTPFSRVSPFIFSIAPNRTTKKLSNSTRRMHTICTKAIRSFSLCQHRGDDGY